MAFRKYHGITDLPFAIVGGVHDLRDARTVKRMIDLVRQVAAVTGDQVVLIVIDTLSRALCGGDENSSKDIGALVNATSQLQDATAAHIMWIYHMPHDSGNERLRGHGALLGALDTTIHVVKTADGTRTATVIKANDSEEGERVAFTLKSVTIGEETTAPIVIPADAAAVRPPSPKRKLSDRHKLALAALTETIITNGRPPPAGLQLPQSTKAVTLDQWRDELFRRHVLDHTDPNPRQDFKRICDGLSARFLIGSQEGLVWPAA